jgi:hypothetical protein
VLLRTAKLLVVFGLSLTLSLHWTVLQSVAWMSMLVQYSQDGLPKALTKTFDGKHPCDLCKMVQKGKQTEEKQVQKPEIKFDSLLAIASIYVPMPPPLGVVSHGDATSDQRVESPPHPPPRFA